MSSIVDRRENGKGKSSSNRQRFLRRVNKHVKESIKKDIKEGKIADIMSPGGHNVNISKKSIKEPSFRHKPSGTTDRVHPGNRDFVPGDKVPKPKGGSGSGASDGVGDGNGEDDFDFVISKQEYLDIFFEDLALPEMVKKYLSAIVESKLKRAGYSVSGVPSRLNYVRSLKQSVGRRAALRNPKKRRLEELEAELVLLIEATPVDIGLIKNLQEQIEGLKRRIKAVPFIDNIDLRYNRFEKVDIPTTRAVMFMLMDVSGSMDQHKKEMAKRFYMLLYLFLSGTYEHIDLVPIRYHSEAKEVDEQEFFYGKETGGTRVSPALVLARDILHERYDSTWNVYFCHASDGDNESGDTRDCVTLINEILEDTQYYAYIQVGEENREMIDNELSAMFDDSILGNFDNVDMAFINDASDIFPVFRKLFKKKGIE
jgi:uncharacterized sporulation protein YeaH/YhbH (DUF444 family)